MSSNWPEHAEDVGDAMVEISQWVDNAPLNVVRDPEAATWGRLAKLQEEVGEVVRAFIAYIGGNPRKPPKEDGLIEVGDELLDVATTALCAYEHMTGHQGLALPDLFDHVYKVQTRARAHPHQVIS